MGHGDDMVGFLHNGPSDGMAITFFGSLKSIRKIKQTPSRIPISVLNTERERDMPESPTRDKDREPRFAYNMDSCNQQFCPMLKERMEQHQHHHQRHSSFKTSSHHQRCGRDSRTGETSPIISRHCLSTKSGPDQNIKPSRTKYSSITDDFGPKTINKSNVIDSNNAATTSTTYANNEFNNGADDNLALKRSETRELVSPTRNIYKDYVQREVREWFQEVPLYPTFGCNSQFDIDSLLYDLSVKINSLLNEADDTCYEHKVKFYTDQFLNCISIGCPGTKRDQDLLKNKLNENLLRRMQNLNKEMLGNMNVTDTNRENIRTPSNRYSIGMQNNPDKEISRKLNRFSIEIEEEVNSWLSMIKFRKNSGTNMEVDKKDVCDILIKRLAPLLNKPINCHYKLKLKSAIIDVLSNLPIGAKTSKNKNIHLHKFADNLASRLVSIRTNNRDDKSYLSFKNIRPVYQADTIVLNKEFEFVIHREINKSITDTRFAHNTYVKKEITDIIMNAINSPAPEEIDVKKEICNILKNAFIIPDILATNIARAVIKKVQTVFNQFYNKDAINNALSNTKPQINRNISVFTSEEWCCPNFLATSTSKKMKEPKLRPKLNPEEIEYTDKVSNLIRAWMETLPEQFNAPDEKDFKETVIMDLAGEITDAAKLEQLASVNENEKWLNYLIYKWLNKLNVFDLEDLSPQVENFLNKLKDIPIPILTKPQHGNRQAMANIQHMEGEQGWVEYFLPKGQDILEDEISIWLNEQPSYIFEINTDRSYRNQNINRLAELLGEKLSTKTPEKEILNDVEQWLNNIIKPEERNKASILADSLKSRIINLPQDTTLATARDKKIYQRAENLEAKYNPKQTFKTHSSNNDTIKLDETMSQFIAKFIEHNYDVDDIMARSAFTHLLKTKLQKLNPPTRKEVYDNIANTETLSREKLTKELEYIKDISDWLKNIPMNGYYNIAGNRERIDFVNDLAGNILDVEEEREANPDAMDYNMYMASIISQFIVQLPIVQEYRNNKNMMFIIDQLVGKVIAHRKTVQNKTNETMDTSGIHIGNIGDFIEEYVRVNGSEIADDQVKMEAWSVRLLAEIKKMIRENTDPTELSKAHVYKKLTNVSLPGDESVEQFENELHCIKEISEWSKNLPLLPISKDDEKERIKMICALTEKITERNTRKKHNPNDMEADAEFTEYVAKWISDLSLDGTHEVLVDVVIQQLINRIEKIKTQKEKPYIDFIQFNELQTDNIPVKNKQSSSKLQAKTKQLKNPAEKIVNVIEAWSTSLPIKANDENTVQSIKNKITKQLFQKVAELNMDPNTFNNNLLYRDLIAHEISTIINELPQNSELEKNKDKFTNELVQNITTAQCIIKENSAGEIYKHKLENCIAASIPHPVNNKEEYDLGFEIYKSRLADMFILENIDHSNDAARNKYERILRDEIDRHCDSVKYKNATPLTNDEIYNELYSSLFKVPVPSESSVKSKVEEIKTRCEIDAWFKKLPLRPAVDLTELYNRDIIVSTLAKKIHMIENEPKPADKIRKEIMKWLLKVPFLSRQEIQAEHFSKQLEDSLKLSKEQRKCVVTDQSPKSEKNKKGTKSKEKLKGERNSKVPGQYCASAIFYDNEQAKPQKKAAEVVFEIVENWCNQLPIRAKTPQEEENAVSIKDSLFTRIVMKISELIMNSDSFKDDFLFDDLLDEELDKLLSFVPTCCNFEGTKAARKKQLKDAISAVKPAFKKEKAKHQYKLDLDETLHTVLLTTPGTTNEKDEILNELKDEIIENFVLYNYVKDDNDGRLAYKSKFHETVAKFNAMVIENNRDTLSPLMKRNRLLCELTKISTPSEDCIKEEVDEIRMKIEVSELFDDLSISQKNKGKYKLVAQVKSNLAKRLNAIEMKGHNNENDVIMAQEIERNLKKLNTEVKSETAAEFVEKLKCNESTRRAPKNKAEKISDGGGIFINDYKNLQKNEPNKFNHSDTTLTHLPKAETVVVCECPKESSFKTKHFSAVECDCARKPEELIMHSQESPEPGELEEEDMCNCGRTKRRRHCLIPMKWYCNGPGEIANCRIPAGFCYY